MGPGVLGTPNAASVHSRSDWHGRPVAGKKEGEQERPGLMLIAISLAQCKADKIVIWYQW